MNIKEIASHLSSLKSEITDGASGLVVTISTTDGRGWNYQTVNNPLDGAGCGSRHWAAVYLFRDSNCRKLARNAVGELREAMENE